MLSELAWVSVLNVLGMAEKDELLEPEDDSPSDAPRPRNAATGSERGAPPPERLETDAERGRSSAVGSEAIGRASSAPAGGTHEI